MSYMPPTYIIGFPGQFPCWGHKKNLVIWTAKKLIVTRVTRVIGPEDPAPPRNKGNPMVFQSPLGSLTYGCFLKWWYPRIINFNRVFHYKPSILGLPLIFGNTHMKKIVKNAAWKDGSFPSLWRLAKMDGAWKWMKMIPIMAWRKGGYSSCFQPDHFQVLFETLADSPKLTWVQHTQCITSAIIEDRPPSWYSNCKDSMVSTVTGKSVASRQPVFNNSSQEKSAFLPSKTSTMCFFGTASKYIQASFQRKKTTTLSIPFDVVFPFTHLPYRPMIDKKNVLWNLGVAPYQ